MLTGRLFELGARRVLSSSWRTATTESGADRLNRNPGRLDLDCRPNDTGGRVWRFVAVLVLAMIGMVRFIAFADFIQQCALFTVFGAAAILPVVLNPTRNWARGFFLCFDMVYAAACIGAWFGAIHYPVSRGRGLHRWPHPWPPVRHHGLARGIAIGAGRC